MYSSINLKTACKVLNLLGMLKSKNYYVIGQAKTKTDQLVHLYERFSDKGSLFSKRFIKWLPNPIFHPFIL